MANVKVSELTAATTLDEDDLLCSVDTSDSETKKITYGNFLRTIPDGTAAAPSIANTGDTDTGILFPSDNTVAISCGGTQRFSVDGSGNVSISGTLTVSGSTTTIESTTLTVDDKNIELGSVASPSDTTADGGGITLKGATDHTIIWTNSTDSWDFSEHVNAASGKEFRIAGTSVLSATTLGSGVTSSSLTSVGTLGSLAVTNNITVGGTVDGRDLATDGTKLDGIEANATADQTASEILTAIKTVDGSGTGLDADLLDGVEASSFLRSDAADVKTSGSLRFDDSVKLELGNGSDLQIYHDGSNSYIDDAGTGELRIRVAGTAGSGFYKYSNNEKLATFQPDGAVTLYHNNVAKLATKSDGVDVTGEVQCDSLDVDGAADITGNVTLHGNLDLQDDDRLNIGSGDDFTIRHNGSDSIFENDTGNLFISNYANDADIFLRSDDGSGGIANYVQCDGSAGSVRLHHYGNLKFLTKSDGVDVTGEVQCDSLDVDGAGDISGNLTVDSGTLFVDSSNNRVGVGTTSPDALLEIESSAGGTSLSINNTGTSGRQYILQSTSSSSSIGGGKFSIYDGDAPAHRLVLDSSGRLLLGTTTEGAVNADNLTVADSGDCGITIRSGSTSAGSLFFSDATSGNGEFAGYVQYDHSNNTLSFGTNFTQRLAINSSGAWGIEGASNYGTSGQVLTSNGNDSPTWQDVSAAAGTQIVNGTSNVSVLSDANIQFTRGGTLQAQVDGSGLLFQDSKKARFGASADLEIYHDGSNSYVQEKGTGDLIIETTGGNIDLKHGSEYLARFKNDADVELYYNNDKKFETKSDGVLVLGELQSTTLDVNGDADINGQLVSNRIVVRDNGASSPLVAIRADDDAPWAFNIGNDTYSSSDQHGLRIYQQADGSIRIRNSGNSAWEELRLEQQNGGTSNTGILLTTSREVKLYYQGSNKLTTKSDGVDITGELQCDSLDVDGAANITGNIDIDGAIRHNGDADTYIEFNAANTFRVVTAGSERFRVRSTGAIAIGGSGNYGSSGQVLTSNGDAAPSWQDAGGSGYTAYAFATTERNGSITSSQGFASCTRNGTGSYTLTFSTAVGSTAYTVVIGNEDGDNNYLRRSTKASASISYTSRSTGDQARDMRQGVVVFKQ